MPTHRTGINIKQFNLLYQI